MFTWKDGFSSKVLEFDNQHKKLFDLGNQLYSLVRHQSEEDNYDEIMQALKELQDYTVYHFESEERLMKEFRYPKLFSHKAEHDAFIKEIEKLLQKDVDEDQVKISLEIIKFIAHWIENHILKTDSQYGEFLRSKGVS